MDQTNVDKNTYWQEQDQRVIAFERDLPYPNFRLDQVPVEKLQKEEDIEGIPEEGGCYWIWTTEPVHHKMHRNPTPEPFDGGEIIYNGLTKDSIRWRIRNHLFANPDEGWSGISIDLYMKHSPSHRKRAMKEHPGRQKVAYYGDQKITSKATLQQLHLSETEQNYVNQTNSKEFFFRNGINIREPKHQSFEFRVYFIVGLKSSTYLDFIEKRWREEYGLPRMCSYMSGR